MPARSAGRGALECVRHVCPHARAPRSASPRNKCDCSMVRRRRTGRPRHSPASYPRWHDSRAGNRSDTRRICRDRALPARRRLMTERLSIIVPVLNEEARISAQLAALIGLSGVDEIIVVDGGSGDRTTQFAAAAGCCVVTAPRGRGTQMNAGAVAASGDILLFLHVDVTLPVNAPSLIRTALAD